ncbi:MAG: RluA family pseudouridine synthase [Tidjanibacter sp.]|nr:RluA family pseudouridine synthase [Tidjanibacter sp.]MBR6814112.1 RluA family pseudouridine synthase [Tidjanibacter sp.]
MILRPEREMPLLEFLFEAMPDKSRTTVKSYLTKRLVSVNDLTTTQFNFPLRAGDRVTIGSGRTAPTPKSQQLQIVYEDSDIVVINKRNGLLSIGTDKEQKRTAYYILSDYVKQQHPDNKIFVVHRLDRETSGLMMFAKSQEVQEQMQRGWHRLVLDRRYVAVIEGALPGGEGEINAPLTQDRNHKMWVTRPGEGEEAITYYTTLRRGENYSLVDLRLVTGKKNQIRAHLEWKGTSIAGDKKYSAKTNPASRVCLHAYRLSIVHPTTGKQLDFDTRIPKLFEDCVK